MASVAELKEKHAAATASVNSLRERLRQRRETLLDTDGEASLPAPRREPSLVGFGEFAGIC
jgi:guanine nucleotide-binding protein G(I)/G(S)/G(T) subunit beta-1